jgi:hypothetical protein
MSNNHYVGIELEYSDILCNIAQVRLEKIFNYPFNEWKNSYSTEDKYKLNYNKWNAVCDNTIKNTDGTKCSLTYMIDGNIKPISSIEKHIKYSSGIEAVSPKTNEYNKLISDIKKINEQMLSGGATISRLLDNALHIHIDASNLTIDQIKEIPTKCLPIQKSLTKLLTYDGIEVPLYTENDAELFKECSSINDIKKVYIAKEGHGKYSINHYLNRRIIDIGPWIKKPQHLKTIEFRAYSMSSNIKYIEECLYLSLDIFEYLIKDKPLIDFEKRVDYIESIN